MIFKKITSIVAALMLGTLLFAQSTEVASSNVAEDEVVAENTAVSQEQKDFNQVQQMDTAVANADSEGTGTEENSDVTESDKKETPSLTDGISDQVKLFNQFIENLEEIITDPIVIGRVIFGILGFFFTLIIYKVVRKVFKKTAAKRMEERNAKIVLRLFKYVFYVIVVMIVLNMMGISLTAIWGAAGIAGVAIGFAAQTSVSNLISGLFVLTEKTVKIGDFIEVDGVTGTIDHVGLLAIRVITLDNQLIRIPNSTIINSKLWNYSTYDYRRYVFELSVDYGTDLEKAIEVLKTVPAMCPTVVTDKPEYAPNAFCTTLGDSGINMNLVVWSERANFLKTKGDVCLNTVKALNAAGINIPFNRMDVTLLAEDTVPAISKKA